MLTDKPQILTLYYQKPMASNKIKFAF